MSGPRREGSSTRPGAGPAARIAARLLLPVRLALLLVVAGLSGVERVEVLRFHQMGAFKWHELGLDYALEHTRPPDKALVDRVRHQFAARGLRVY